MGFLKILKKKKDKSKAAVDGGKAAKEVHKPQSPQVAKTNAVPVLEENAAARPENAQADASDAPTIGSSAHNSAENLPQLAATSPNGGGIAVTGGAPAVEIANRAASGESAAPPAPALPPRPPAAASPTPLITTTNGPPKPGTIRRSKSIVEFDKSEHKVLVPIETQLGKPIESVYDGVHDGPELGTGITGVVRKVTHKKTKHEYAVKKLDLGKIKTEAELQQLREEIAIMCQLDHPNVVRLEEVYESPTAIYLVQELCLGGDLFDRLDAQEDVHYTEAKCARLIKQIVDAVRYIHDRGIIHRDLKLENFMFSSMSADSELRMIDFGLSKHFSLGDVQDEAVGSAYTCAPEVIRGMYNEKADEWSIGVITYLLLSGETPFGGAGEEDISPMQTRAAILSANYVFEPDYIWENVSQEAIDFIQSLLVTDPNKRPTVKDLQKSEWLTKWTNADNDAEAKELSAGVVQALVGFKEKEDMTKLLCEVLSFTLLPGQLEELRKQFELLDPEGRGEISLGALKRALMNNAEAGSLGSLTEEEVEDIFEAMRVRKTEMRIHWHEFIAAALSQVEIDDRNLELAFQRLDTENRGYIEVENIIELMGGYVDEDEGRIREMWQDVFKDKSFDTCRRVSKKEFVLLMKGQRQERRPSRSLNAEEMPPILDMVEQDSSRAVTLPESDISSPGAEPVAKALKDEEATPLVVNRMLYRAHRQSRLAVLEATRRFEEEQMKRTAKKLNQALNRDTGKNVSSNNLYRAGLIMRHSQNAAASSDSVRSMVQQAQDEMHRKIDVAKRRSGRRHDRKKSVSNLAEMCCETLPAHLAESIGSLPPNSTGSTSSVGRSRGRRKMASSLEGMFSFDPNALSAHAEDVCHSSDSSQV